MTVSSQVMNSPWFVKLLADDFQKERNKDTTTLHALCLVSRTLNVFFCRVLYKNLSIDWRWSRHKGQQLAKSRHLAYTKELYVDFWQEDGEYMDNQPEIDKRCKRLRALLSELFRKMPNVTHIQCYPVDLSHVWLREMEELPRLESLVLLQMYATNVTAANKAIINRLENSSVLHSPSALSALKSLKLHGMWWRKGERWIYYGGSADVNWPKCIASFMLNARHLAELHLSTLSEVSDDMLEAACNEYTARCSDGHLLPLKNLHLDKNMDMPALNTLREVFDLSALETINVSGCCRAAAGLGVLEVCTPTVTPNLQRITIDRIPPESWYMIPEITQGRTSFRSDPLCWGRGVNVYELARLSRAPQLWLPRPRGFNDRVDYGGLLHSVANCDWLTHLALCLVLDHHLGEVSSASEDDVNADYSEDDAESDYSEWESEYSSNDAPNLAQLEAALPALCEVLKTLSRLKILCVEFLTATQGRFEEADLEYALMTAKLVAKACPTLQYIAIQGIIFVATWPTHAAGSTEEPEPFVQHMTLCTKSDQVVHFVEEYDTFDFEGEAALMDVMLYSV